MTLFTFSMASHSSCACFQTFHVKSTTTAQIQSGENAELCSLNTMFHAAICVINLRTTINNFTYNSLLTTKSFRFDCFLFSTKLLSGCPCECTFFHTPR